MTKSQVVLLESATTTAVIKESIAASTSAHNGNVADRPSPESCLEKGLWEVELVYYNVSNGHRSLHNTLGVDPKHRRRGKVYKCLADSEYKCFESHDGTVYWPGDFVYLESTPSESYVVANVSSFKPAKREQISMKLTRYYRPEDIPEVTYSLLIQERKEHGVYEKMLEYESRELFQNEIACTYPISYLRGKCNVKSYRHISELDEAWITADNSFFTCLNYNLDSSRLAAFHGTIRVGARHQAELPSFPTESVSEDRDRDQLLYKPGEVCEDTEQQYIRGCRAYRTLCLNRKPLIPQLEKDSRLGDLLFDDAIVNLHTCNYNVLRAQQVMEEHDNLLAEDNSFLNGEEVKKFTKGIKNYGKNFSKIQKELLPHLMREHLVNFYYMWKKSRDATRPRAITRVRLAPKKALKNGTPIRPASADLLDYDSASEDEFNEIERACHHCYSQKSRDWHHAGIHRQLMCTDCRMHFKRYGNLRNVERPSTVPVCLYRGSPTDEGVRTRANGKQRRNIDSPCDEKLSRKSRKRLHRHSAMSDELIEGESPKMNGRKKASSEPQEGGENSGSESSASDKMKKQTINGYHSSSSSASSPGVGEPPKDEIMDEVVKKENGVNQIKTENRLEDSSVDIKDEKENFVKMEQDDDDMEYCFLAGDALRKHVEEMERDVGVNVDIIINRPRSDRSPLYSNAGNELPVLPAVIFKQVVQRPSKNTCARTDFVYFNNSSESWTERRKRREERDRKIVLERKRHEEEEEKQRSLSTRPSTSASQVSIPTTSSMSNLMQPKLSINGLPSNMANDHMANVLQRIQMGAIPPPMTIDPRTAMFQQQAQHQFMYMLDQHQKMAAKQQAQLEAQRLAEQKQLEEQKRQQEVHQQQLQRQREAAAAQAAQINGVKQQQQQGMLNQMMVNPQQLQLMMNQQLLQSNPNLLMSMMQQGQAVQMAVAADYERKRMEMEYIQQQQRAQAMAAQRAAEVAQMQQQQQQNPASATLNHFANIVNGGGNGSVPNDVQNIQLMMAMMHQQQQQQQQQQIQQQQQTLAVQEAIRKYNEMARTA